MVRLKYALLAIILTASSGAHGQIPDPASSRMNAVSCEKLPAPLAIDVQILDDAKQIVAFKSQFEDDLRSKGVQLSNNAATIAILDIKTVREIQREPKDPPPEGTLDRGVGDLERNTPIFVPGNVFSNKGESILGGDRSQQEGFSLNQLQVSVSLNDRHDGRCIWQGKVLHDLKGDEDPDALTQKFIPILARAMGKSIPNRELTVSP